MPLVMSMSAKVTSSAGAPGTRPCAQASKTNVSFGHGEKAMQSGVRALGRVSPVSVESVMPSNVAVREQLPERVRERGERLGDPPGRAVAGPDGVGDRTDLQDGHPVRGGGLGDAEALHGLGQRLRDARQQLGGSGGGPVTWRRSARGPERPGGLDDGPYEIGRRLVRAVPKPSSATDANPSESPRPGRPRRSVGDHGVADLDATGREAAADSGRDDQAVGPALVRGRHQRGRGPGPAAPGPTPTASASNGPARCSSAPGHLPRLRHRPRTRA